MNKNKGAAIKNIIIKPTNQVGLLKTMPKRYDETTFKKPLICSKGIF